jgi:hypothetical protein
MAECKKGAVEGRPLLTACRRRLPVLAFGKIARFSAALRGGRVAYFLQQGSGKVYAVVSPFVPHIF